MHGGVLGVRGRPDFSRFDPRPGRSHFSNFGAHLHQVHFSRFDPKVPHFSRKFPPVTVKPYY